MREIEQYLEIKANNPFVSRKERQYCKNILDYINALETDNDIMKQDLNENILYKDELQELIEKERTLAEAQTTYEVNKMWKEKIENEINELEKLTKDEKKTFYYANYRYLMNILQKLLNGEDNK